jgi:hypothetical protein
MKQLKIYLPPPTNWQDFQSLLKDIAAVRYNPATVVEYGTQGQRQHGVDVYAEDFFGKKIGIQAKETKSELTRAVILKEAGKARKFSQHLDLFIVATTAKTDANLQSEVITINESTDFSFTIRVDFWNDLMNDINRYAMVLNDCYQSYREAFHQTDESSHLSCLRVAFDRPAFKDDFLVERNFDDFEEALVATKRLFRTGFTVDRWSQIPVVQTVPVDYLPEGPYRKFVSKIEHRLEAIYKSYLADKNRILRDHRYARDRAGHYNIVRRDLLIELNKRLVRSDLQEIRFSYP